MFLLKPDQRPASGEQVELFLIWTEQCSLLSEHPTNHHNYDHYVRTLVSGTEFCLDLQSSLYLICHPSIIKPGPLYQVCKSIHHQSRFFLLGQIMTQYFPMVMKQGNRPKPYQILLTYKCVFSISLRLYFPMFIMFWDRDTNLGWFPTDPKIFFTIGLWMFFVVLLFWISWWGKIWMCGRTKKKRLSDFRASLHLLLVWVRLGFIWGDRSNLLFKCFLKT